MKQRNRDKRSARKEVQAMKRGNVGWSEAIEELTADALADDSPFPLPNGTQADPRQAWVLPSNEQEK